MKSEDQAQVAPQFETAAAPGRNENSRSESLSGNRALLVEILNEFLEGERAGARTARAFAAESADPRVIALMRRIAKDEAWCCGMLARHIERLDGQASRETGAFFEKALRRNGIRERLTYLNKGQSWVVQRLNEILPDLRDQLLRRDLYRMLRMHERNVKRCGSMMS